MVEHPTSLAPRPDGGAPKLGLALSGGGLRAALFHIGTLMALAQYGVLKYVEVLSTVSGGSIVGAAFYLRLVAALREQEGSLSDEQLVAVVADLARGFPAGVRRDMWVRAFANPFALVRMGTPSYSLSDRLGELFDRYFLRDLIRGPVGPVRIRDVAAPGGAYGCPADGRQPELLLNATSLNSGGDWRFTPDSMGQPAREGFVRDLDKTTRFRSPRSYAELSKHLQDLPFATAVAASAAMPSVLPPMAISGMYGGARLQLADGGVHDNQGIQSLLDAGCTSFIVSDTGAQLLDDDQVPPSLFPVMQRVSDVMFGRLRQEQLFRLAERGTDRRGPLLLSHLLRGVAVPVRGYIDSSGNQHHFPPEEAWGGSSTRFGVDPDVMKALSNVRTDLDAFSEVEAGSLMSAGYLVTRAGCEGDEWTGREPFVGRPVEIPEEVLGLGVLRSHLASGGPSGYLRLLHAGSQRFLKLFRIDRWPLEVLKVLVALLVIAGAVALWRNRATVIPLGWIAAVALVLVVEVFLRMTAAGAGVLDSRWLSPFFCLRNAVVALPIAAFALFELHVIDPLFLQRGSYVRLGERGRGSR